MKAILQQDVKGMGKKGDLVNVSDGYARNYLIPKKMAVKADKANMNILNSQKQAEEKRKDKEIANAKELAQKIEKLTIILKVKAGENGKLFGSITSKDITEELKKQYKIQIDKRKIVLDDAIKNLGTIEIDVKLYEGISSKLKVKIESE